MFFTKKIKKPSNKQQGKSLLNNEGGKKTMDIDTKREKSVDTIRKACGTLPNRVEEVKTSIFYGCEKLDVEIVDKPENIYKAIFSIATATWGNDQYENKWQLLEPFERYLVVLNALKGKTLPTALEAPKFTFIVRGVPRHCFDQMARTRIGAGFGSIGSRDNSKLDSSFILYSEYVTIDAHILYSVIKYLERCKEVYAEIINESKESYQIARSLLPLSYHHPFVFTQNLLSLIQQAKRRMCFGEEEFICGIHWFIRQLFVRMGVKLIADFMRPACDFAGKCLYSKTDGSELFGNLFRGCGRHKGESSYAEFNKSCTNASKLENQLKRFKFSTEGAIGPIIPNPNEYVNFTPDQNGYLKLGEGDKFLFNSK